MRRKLTSLGLAAALAAGLFAATPGTALARDQTGLGIGANVSLGGISGLALNIWVSPSIMLEAMLATSIGLARGDGHDVVFNLGGSFGVFGVLAGGDMTNLMLGGRLAVLGVINSTGNGGMGPAAEDDFVIIEPDAVLRVEHWFDDHFAINAQVGVQFLIVPDPGPGAVGAPGTAFGFGVGATSGFFGGAGFTYYFDSAGPSASASASSSGSASSAPPPPPPSSTSTTTTTTSTGTGTEAAPWE
jgi:hypothetical protein